MKTFLFGYVKIMRVNETKQVRFWKLSSSLSISVLITFETSKFIEFLKRQCLSGSTFRLICDCSLSISIFLSTCLSDCPSVLLQFVLLYFFCMSVCCSTHLPICLSSYIYIIISVCLSVSRYVSVFVNLSVNRIVCLFVWKCIFLSACIL